MINGSTVLVGLLGHPVQHSLSPAMQNAALEALAMNWSYLALPCRSDALKDVLNGLHAVGCRGLNVTIPHKQAVATLCTELSPLAQRLGAVNTLIPLESGGWRGTNTDVEGFLAPLGDHRQWAGQQAMVLGCGGSARAVVAGLQTLKLATITVVGRRPQALEIFLRDLSTDQAPLLGFLDHDAALPERIGSMHLVVNTTPVGMAQHGEADAMPLNQTIWEALPASATMYDLIYTPRPTPWLAWGAEGKRRCIDGLEMLVQQGAAALRLWSGRDDVPIAAMRSAAETALKL